MLASREDAIVGFVGEIYLGKSTFRGEAGLAERILVLPIGFGGERRLPKELLEVALGLGGEAGLI